MNSRVYSPQVKIRRLCTRLLDKGWSEEEILSRTRIDKRRFSLLKDGLLVPRPKELKQVRALFRVTCPKDYEEVKSVWEHKGGWPKTPPTKPTVRMLDLLITVQEFQGANGHVFSEKGDTLVAGKLAKKEWLKFDTNDHGERIYFITPSGSNVIKEHGFAA